MDAVAPGARVVIRDAEWLVRKVDTTSSGGYAIHAIGISEPVKERDAIFLTALERNITVMDPAQTKLIPDTSPHFRNALLYIESLLRQTPPTDPPSEEKLYIGHKATMDMVSYQLDPAVQALRQPRQRLLIADAVGLGKTMEAGGPAGGTDSAWPWQTHSGGHLEEHADTVSEGTMGPVRHSPGAARFGWHPAGTAPDSQ